MICRDKFNYHSNNDDLVNFVKYILNSRSSFPDITLPKLNCISEQIFLPVSSSKLIKKVNFEEIESQRFLSIQKRSIRNNSPKNVYCSNIWNNNKRSTSCKFLPRNFNKEKPFYKYMSSKKFVAGTDLKNNRRTVSPFREKVCLACKKNVQRGETSLLIKKKMSTFPSRNLVPFDNDQHLFSKIFKYNPLTTNQIKTCTTGEFFPKKGKTFCSNTLPKYVSSISSFEKNVELRDAPHHNKFIHDINNKTIVSYANSLDKKTVKESFIFLGDMSMKKTNSNCSSDPSLKKRWTKLTNTEPIKVRKEELLTLASIERLSI